jgi:hypothetical protein
VVAPSLRAAEYKKRIIEPTCFLYRQFSAWL